MVARSCVLIAVLALLTCNAAAAGSDYHIGIGMNCFIEHQWLVADTTRLYITDCYTGKADITGPAADVNMMVHKGHLVLSKSYTVANNELVQCIDTLND